MLFRPLRDVASILLVVGTGKDKRSEKMLIDSTTSMGRITFAAQQTSPQVPSTQTSFVEDSSNEVLGTQQLPAVSSGSPLSPTSAFFVMEQAQMGTQSGSVLPTGIQDEMQEAATNSQYGDEVAAQMSNAPHSAVLASHVFDATYQADQATVDSIQPQLTSLYDSDKAAGKSGAETISDILKFEISQPQSFWNAVDPDHLQSGDAKGYAQAELDTLQTQMQPSAAS